MYLTHRESHVLFIYDLDAKTRCKIIPRNKKPERLFWNILEKFPGDRESVPVAGTAQEKKEGNAFR